MTQGGEFSDAGGGFSDTRGGFTHLLPGAAAVGGDGDSEHGADAVFDLRVGVGVVAHLPGCIVIYIYDRMRYDMT